MTTPPIPTSPILDTNYLLVVLQELGAALRARSDPEHIYTAAALANFGAVAWGVAALKPQDYLYRPICTRPASVAAVGILLVAFCVVTKLIREHKKFAEIKKQYSAVARLLKAHPNGDVIPSNWTEPAGTGSGYSVLIVIVTAFAAIVFCLALGR
jgi:hypothetical protein